MSFYGDVLKKETEAMDRKEKDFAPWSFKLNAEPKKGLKLSHTHKEGGSGVDVTKIELPNMPMVEGMKMSYEFDKDKFTKTGSMDVWKKDGHCLNSANMAVKYVWTPKDAKHLINVTKKCATANLGGFHAYWQSEVDFTKVNKEATANKEKTADKIEHKHSVNLKGEDWQFGVAADVLSEKKKVGVKCSYNVCSAATMWAKVDSEFPQEKHNSVAVGAQWNNAGWEHFMQVTAHLQNDKKEYTGFFGQPVDVALGHNYKVSAATDLQCSYKMNADVEGHHNVSHKINENLTAKMHQHFFSKNLNKEGGAVDVGLELSYKL